MQLQSELHTPYFRRLHTRLTILVVAMMFSLCPDTMAGNDDTQRKTVLLLGDSNTWIGGDDCSNPTGWNYWLARMHPDMNFVSYARSGATWTATANSEIDDTQYAEVLDDNNIIYNQFVRIGHDNITNKIRTEDVDMVIISCGTNDAWFADRRPGIFDVSVSEVMSEPFKSVYLRKPSEYTSLAGSAMLAISGLHALFFNARILLLTPSQCTAASAERITLVGDILEQVGREFTARSDMYGHIDVGVIRLDTGGPIDAEAERQNRCLTTDGTHTSAEGARRVAEYVDSRMRDLWP